MNLRHVSNRKKKKKKIKRTKKEKKKKSTRWGLEVNFKGIFESSFYELSFISFLFILDT